MHVFILPNRRCTSSLQAKQKTRQERGMVALHGSSRPQAHYIYEKNGKFRMVRTKYIHPYCNKIDSEAISTIVVTFNDNIARALKAHKQQSVPTSIKPAAPPLQSTAHNCKYPDVKEWSVVHENELNQLDEHQTIDWSTPTFVPPIQPLPIKMK